MYKCESIPFFDVFPFSDRSDHNCDPSDPSSYLSSSMATCLAPMVSVEAKQGWYAPITDKVVGRVSEVVGRGRGHARVQEENQAAVGLRQLHLDVHVLVQGHHVGHLSHLVSRKRSK